MQLRKPRTRKISVGKTPEILELARKVGIHLDSEAVLHVIRLGMESPRSESELLQRVNQLEEKKRSLESEFHQIVVRLMPLESRFVGIRNQIGRVYRDNRVLVFHLCARTFTKKRERRMRDRLIKKYLADLKPS